MDNNLILPVHSHCIQEIEIHNDKGTCVPMDFYNIKSIDYKKLVDWNETANTISFVYEHIIVDNACNKEKSMGSDNHVITHSTNTSSDKINRSSSFEYFGQEIPYYFVQDFKHSNIIKYYASEKMPETTSEKSIGLHTNQFTGNCTIVSHTFENGVGTIKLSNDITYIPKYAFYGADFSYIELPETVSGFGWACFATGTYMPSGVTCDKFVIPDSVISCDSHPFNGRRTKELYVGSQYPKTIQFGENAPFVTEKVTINLDRFILTGYSTYLTAEKLIIGENVTTILDNAVRSFRNFKTIEISKNVTSIGWGAFYYCTSLTSVTVNAATPPTLGSNAFSDTNDCPIYVPSGSVNAYKAASGWSTYSSRIQAIP